MKASRFLFTLAAILTPCGFVQAQSAPAAPSNPQETQQRTEAAKPRAGQTSAPLVLKDVGPASTEGVAASAARDLAGRKETEAKDRVEGGDKNRAGEGSTLPEGAVVEFHAAPSGAGEKVSAPASSGGRRRVHGELYGAAGTGGRAAAESVGVTSKDKRTSLYLGSDQTRSEPPQSH